MANPLFDIQITNSIFSNAYASNGGGFYIESPLMRNIQITDCNFINMKSSQNGGGFSIKDMSGKLSL